MFQAERSIVIDAPVERVFAYASDWRIWHEWFEGVSSFTPTTESTTGTGTRYAYKASVMGVRIPVEIEIQDYVENKGWNGVSTKGAPHRTRWRFDKVGNSTRFTYGLEGQLPIPVIGKWLDRLFLQPQWEKILANSLDNLKKKFQEENQQSTIRSTKKEMAKPLLISVIGILLFFFYGCKCDEEPVITSFVFVGLSPSAVGSINQMDHTIQVPVPAGTDLASLTPNIQVGDPECHTLTPPSGQQQDFTVPVYYEVQNEAGSVNSYEVLVRFKEAEANRFSDDSIAIQWTTGSDMPVPSGWGTSVVLDNKIYVIGGGTDNRALVEKLQVYDPVTDQWDLSKSTPLYPRYAQGACTVNGKIYVFGGAIEYPGPVYDNIQVYDPETNIWKDHGTMTSPRDAFSTVAYDGKIYLLGGETNEPSSNADILDLVEAFDPETDSWETLAPMPSPRAYFSACVVNGKIYAIGGLHKFPFPGLNTIFEYDPVADTWKEKQPLKMGRYGISTCVFDGKIFCLGGNPLDLASDGSSSVEVYDPVLDSVYQATNMKYIRYVATAGVIDGKIYVMGGCNDAHYNTYCNKTEIGVPELD